MWSLIGIAGFCLFLAGMFAIMPSGNVVTHTSDIRIVAPGLTQRVGGSGYNLVVTGDRVNMAVFTEPSWATQLISFEVSPAIAQIIDIPESIMPNNVAEISVRQGQMANAVSRGTPMQINVISGSQSVPVFLRFIQDQSSAEIVFGWSPISSNQWVSWPSSNPSIGEQRVVKLDVGGLGSNVFAVNPHLFIDGRQITSGVTWDYYVLGEGIVRNSGFSLGWNQVNPVNRRISMPVGMVSHISGLPSGQNFPRVQVLVVAEYRNTLYIDFIYFDLV